MPSNPENPADVVARWIDKLRNGGETFEGWEAASEELRKLGFHVVPYLIEALADKDFSVQTGAGKALAGMGQIAVPDLIAALKHGNERVRLKVALMLYGKTQHPEQLIADLIPVLIEAMRDPDEAVRLWALRALSNYRSHAEKIIPVCIEALKDSGVFVREWAASTLGGFRAAAEQAIPQLTEALVDDDPDVRQAASTAINEIQWKEPPVEGDEWKLA